MKAFLRIILCLLFYRDQLPQLLIFEPQRAPCQQRQIYGKQDVREQRVIQTHVGGNSPAPIAREQYGAEDLCAAKDVEEDRYQPSVPMMGR